MIYLDYNATSIMCDEVRSAMMECTFAPLNPSSVHYFGRQAKALMEEARSNVMALVGQEMTRSNYSLIFTASGTEANNLIVHNFPQGRILISAAEHISMLKHKEYKDNIDLLAIDNNGLVRMDLLANWLDQNRGSDNLVSIMLANNETGVIQPLKEIAALVHEYGALIHSDIAQAVGKIFVDVESLGLDFATLSGHKFGGPVGAAALIHKTKYHTKAQILGGGQEKSSRSGTENVQAIVGFGVAALKAKSFLAKNIQYVKNLRDMLERELNTIVLGDKVDRLPNTSMIVMNGVPAVQQLIAFDMRGIAVSSGSACSSGKVKASHVLKAMGVEDALTTCAIRVSFGAHNKKEDVDRFVVAWQEISNKKEI